MMTTETATTDTTQFHLDENMAPKCFFLIGLPCSGKSTYAAKNFANIPVVSSDNYITAFAKSSGMTYTEAFKSNISIATAAMEKDVSEYLRTKTSFVWDQTNLTADSRMPKLNMIKEAGFECHAYFFNATLEDVKLRNIARQKAEGKFIPEYVLDIMDAMKKWPSLYEGFDTLTFI